MYIETDKGIFDVAINVAQIEITGKCNMHCLHCRGRDSKELNKDMPIWAIKKIIDFAKKHAEGDLIEIVLSGGEPLLHPNIKEILDYCTEVNVLKEITTNGSLIDEQYIELLKKYEISNMSVSMDSAIAEKHDYIRQSKGAFDKAVNAIKLMLNNNINARVRSTISKVNIDEMEDIVLLVESLGVKSLAFGAVIPVGNAINMTDSIFMTKQEMKNFIDKFFLLKQKYEGRIDIITNECLHGLRYLSDLNNSSENDYELNGCTAGVVTFNVLLNGDITPCSMLHERIANIYEDEELDKCYMTSDFIKRLLDRDYDGKCGICKYKYECGGCRVRSKYFYGDYFNTDPLCWI